MKGNPWIDFLRHYGPIPANDNMYDEAVYRQFLKHNVAPITIEVGWVQECIENFKGDSPRSVILTGTAGDGKTYCCRQIWTALEGDRSRWQEMDKVLRIDLPGNRRLLIVKDLSELNLDDAAIIDELIAIAAGEQPDTVFLIAANDGQLLEAFRPGAAVPPDNQRHRVYALIETMLVEGCREDQDGRLRMYNLSRERTSALFDAVLRAIVDHPGWEGCGLCPYATARADGLRCPIFENRERLRGESHISQTLRERLRSLLEVSESDGYHFPIRHLFLLVTNMVLGNGVVRSRLARCADAASAVNTGEGLEASSLYANAFGGNLIPREAIRYPVFATLSRFGIGVLPIGHLDDQVIYGGIGNGRNDMPQDSFYGSNPAFERCRWAYQEGDIDEEGRSLLKAFLVRQRQRLFFMLTSSEMAWRFTVLPHAPQYQMFRDLICKQDPRYRITRKQLILGLNRIMTGLAIICSDELLAVSTGAVSAGAVNRVLEEKVKTSEVKVDFDPGTDVLTLNVPGRKSTAGALLRLSASLFEFILQVAEGALPSNLSRQCLESLERFRLQLLLAVASPEGADHGDCLSFTLIEPAADGTVVTYGIEAYPPTSTSTATEVAS